MKRLAVVLLLVLLGACGGAETPAKTVSIEMRDIAFSPTQITVPAGKLVELRFHNSGSATHDAFIGTASQQREHESEMRDGDSMHHHGGGAVTVEAGKTKSLRYTFDKSDDGILIGCHEEGHYASGMRLTVNVA